MDNALIIFETFLDYRTLPNTIISSQKFIYSLIKVAAGNIVLIALRFGVMRIDGVGGDGVVADFTYR